MTDVVGLLIVGAAFIFLAFCLGSNRLAALSGLANLIGIGCIIAAGIVLILR